MKKIVLCIAVLLIPLLTGCGEKKEVELLLHCGAGIRPAAEALIAAFTAETGIKVNGNYAGSDRLLTQITAMHQGDLFMPGAAMYVDLAAEKGLGDQAAVCTVFYFVPVIFTAKDLGPPVQTLMDLMRPGLRMGLGDERACAVGKKTLKIFEKNKIDYRTIEPNVVMKSGTVNELGVAIQMGSVDAVIIWDANARQFAEYGTMIPIPAEQNSISEVRIMRLKSSVYPEAAQKFIDFAVSEEGQTIIRKMNYTVELAN